MYWLARRDRDERGLIHQVFVIVGMSVLSGALIAGLALPFVALLDKGAENSAAAVKDFPKKLEFKPLDERTRVLAADGSRLAIFYDENRTYATLDEISSKLTQAMVAIEDARFYAHGALDVQGTLRAFLVNQASGATIQGGSSITQQLVKLTLQENASSAAKRRAASAQKYARKFDELRYAVWVEQHLSKDEILEHYLNTAYFGDGAYGVQSAAHHYFSTTAKELTLRESALLAGLVRNPTGYDPTNNRQAARDRRNTVIAKMLDLHIITTGQAKKAAASYLGLRVREVANGCLNSQSPFFCQYMQKYLLTSPALGKTVEERRRALYGGGLTIQTTWDPRFQRAADDSVAHHVYATDQVIGGLAMVEPGTGYVRALAQSRPMGRNEAKGETFENYTVPAQYGGTSGFQPGSTFKAFVLATAIKQGFPLNKTIYSPPSITLPTSSFRTCGGKYLQSSEVHTYKNSTEGGSENLYSGTQNSVNTFFVQLEQQTGLCEPWQLAKAMGVALDDPTNNRVPTFTLGVSDVSPLEMAEAYATFAARGIHCASTPVTEITDRNGDNIPIEGSTCNRVLKPAYADAVNDILKGVMEPPDGFGAAIAPNQESAGKTGTTQSNKAVWFVGYTPTIAAASFLAGVNRKNEPAELIGRSLAGTVLTDASGSGTAGPMWGDAIAAIEGILPNRRFVEPDPTVVDGQVVPIPSFYGYSPNDAASKLTDLGFRPQISYSVSSSAPEGTVAYTSPSYEGTTGETVQIFISTGYVPPPPPTSTPPTFTPPTSTPPTSTPPTSTPPTSTPPTSTPKPQPTPSPDPSPTPKPSPTNPSSDPTPKPKPR
ncbi:MAG: transglycosylase domain-containing protein [Nocardioidaceae bacterium]